MTASDGSDDGEGPQPSWFERLRDGQLPVAFAALLVVLAFSVGALGAKALDALNLLGNPQVVQSEGSGWSLFSKPRAAGAPRRGVPRPDGFAVWETRVDSSGPEPLACIRMSRPLDPTLSYGDYILLSPQPDARPAVSVRGDELCLGGLGFTDRQITLLKGLKAKSGETLAENAEVPFSFGEKPPYIGFAGNGVILPREQADGVGIETVNVARLHVEVWRVVDRNLVRRTISAPDPTGEGQFPNDYGDDSARGEGRLIWQGDVTVTGARAGQKVTTVFPLGAVLKEMQPGGYLIKAKDASGARALKKTSDKQNPDAEDEDYANPPAQARRWVMFTDMALTAYDGSEGLDVVVRSLKSAKILPGLRVTLVAGNGEDLAVTKSDGDGRVRFAKALMNGQDKLKARMVMAYGPQGDLAVLDLQRPPADLSKQGIGGRDDATAGRGEAGLVDGYIYSDRGIYRPGETVHLNTLLRDRETRAVKDRKGWVVVRRPSGTEFARARFEGTPLGSVANDVFLPKTAPRGRWKASLEIDGLTAAAGELAFDVEDFAPQRLAVSAAGREAVPLTAGETRVVDVTARFLYGAAGAGLQTQGEARLKADPDPFPQLKGYAWGDQRKPFDEKFLDLDRTVTDGAGHAVLHLPTFAAHESNQPLMATLTASVFEPGGRPVRESVKFKVRTAPLYLGAKVDLGEAAGREDPLITMDVIGADALGRRIAAAGVNYVLISETWNYDWFQENGRWQWRRTSRDVAIQKGVLNLSAGAPARISRRLGWGDYRLELTGPNGARSVIRFASGWGAPAKDVDAPDIVRVSAGTKAYRQGDTVELTLKAPYGGEAQVAVATDHLIDFKALSVGEQGATVRLKSTAAWGGGAYVLVSVIQPRDPVSSPKPRRALGLVYVPLDPVGRKLDVAIGTPEKQGSKAVLNVPINIAGQGFHGRARVTVAAVDEGILRLTKFASPDPVAWYFGKRALTLNYRDDYGRLLDPNLGAPANINFGGDEVGGEGLTTTPIRTVALWSGAIQTDANGHAVIRLPAPDFNGELRLMVVAWTDDAVGGASKPLTVREPVVADLNLPRFLSPGDRAFATLELHNLEGSPGAYTADLAPHGGIAAAFHQVYPLALGQRTVTRIPITAPSRDGVGAVGFRVMGPGFSTGRDLPIQTRLGWGSVSRTSVALQRPGETYTPPPQLLAGLAPGDISLQVSYSPFRGFDPAPIAEALSRYPYGCTEQLVSGAYPLIYATEVSTDPGLRRAQPVLEAAVGKLLDRQQLDGSFGLWRVGDGDADPWLGAYATDFLLEARKAGAGMPQSAVDRALSAMREVSRPEGFSSIGYRMQYPQTWRGSKEEVRAATQELRRRASAYALYVLAKGGQGDLARLRWWHDVQMKTEPSPLAKAQIAAGLDMMGDKARARDAFRQAVASIGWKDEADYYQSPLRDLAGTIALAYEAGEDDIARSLQVRLEDRVKDPAALNTQEEARLLEAAHYMLRSSGPARITAQGAVPLRGTPGAPRWAVGRLADAHFANAASGAIWRTVTVTGRPVSPPPPSASGLSVSKTLFTLNGAPADPARLRQGDRVVVLISGHSGQSRTSALVVDDPLPAGFEIETTLSSEDAEKGPFKFLGKLTQSSMQEARDDRYIAAMQLPGDKPFAFAYVARAVTPGDFLFPGVEAKDMYRASIYARSGARRTAIAPGS